MRNANKSLKIPYSATVRKWKSDLESTSVIRSLPKVYQFFRLLCPIITPSFN